MRFTKCYQRIDDNGYRHDGLEFECVTPLDETHAEAALKSVVSTYPKLWAAGCLTLVGRGPEQRGEYRDAAGRWQSPSGWVRISEHRLRVIEANQP